MAGVLIPYFRTSRAGVSQQVWRPKVSSGSSSTFRARYRTASPAEPGASLGRLVTKQQCRRLAGRVGMVEYHPRMVVLRYVSSLPPVKPLDSMG